MAHQVEWLFLSPSKMSTIHGKWLIHFYTQLVNLDIMPVRPNHKGSKFNPTSIIQEKKNTALTNVEILIQSHDRVGLEFYH